MYCKCFIGNGINIAYGLRGIVFGLLYSYLFDFNTIQVRWSNGFCTKAGFGLIKINAL